MNLYVTIVSLVFVAIAFGNAFVQSDTSGALRGVAVNAFNIGGGAAAITLAIVRLFGAPSPTILRVAFGLFAVFFVAFIANFNDDGRYRRHLAFVACLVSFTNAFWSAP